MAKSSSFYTPSIKKDIFKSLILSVLIILIFYFVYYYFGERKEIDKSITALFGAVLALSGLMSKQYLIKENISYLNKWKTIEDLIDEILLNDSQEGLEFKKIKLALAEKNNRAELYINYIITEIKLIPIIPMVLVVLYGAALIACGSLIFAMSCLALMLILVVYLAFATMSSNNLLLEVENIDETIEELQGIIEVIRNAT